MWCAIGEGFNAKAQRGRGNAKAQRAQRREKMWSALRELFGGLSPRGRFWLAVVMVVALIAAFVTMTVAGVDLTPFWAILGG